ncbi:MAG: hypothetical protein WD051_01750 [Steroidobacteraceae bacterium]
MRLALQQSIRRFFCPNGVGARATLIFTALLFVVMLSYELAILAYSPKYRPLHFHSSLEVPYRPFLIAWSLLTVLSGLALAAHRQLSSFTRRFVVFRNLLANFLLLVGSTIVGLCIVEIGLRFIDPLGISSFPKVLRFSAKMLIPDPDLRYRLRPGTSYSYDGVEVKTNSVGMRDDEPLEIDSERRILVLGDSVALGSRIPEHGTTFHRLEVLLGGRKAVDVVNTAVSSYNTVQQNRVLESIGDTYAPDLVLLVYVENDVKLEHLVPFYPVEYWRQAVYLPRTVVQSSYTRYLWRLGLFAIQSGGESPQISQVDRVGWEYSREALSRISRWCKDRDVEFIVVFYSMLDPRAAQPYLDLLFEAGTEIGFPVVDSSKYWDNRQLSEIHISAMDAHLNGIGHALLAEGLNGELRRRYPMLVSSDSSN